MNKNNKLFIIKFGDTVEEFKRYLEKEKFGEGVCAPTGDYISQFYKEFKDISKNFSVFWIGVGIKQKKFLRNNNS